MVRCVCVVAAAAVLGTAAPAGAKPDPLATARTAVETGHYPQAEATLRGQKSADAMGLLGRLYRITGRYDDARGLLEPLVSTDPKAFGARLELGLVYRAAGDQPHERAVWNRFFDDYEAARLDKKSARDLLYVAMAARYLGSIADANDTFRDATDADPKGAAGARANIEWASLFLEKYDAGHAEVSLKEALKVLPDDADAHALMARVKLEQGESGGAERELNAALKRNPLHLGAAAIRAEMQVDNEDYAAALETCRRGLQVNPEDARLRTVAAAVSLLTDDKKGYEGERTRVLQNNPRASSFFHGVAEFLVKQHRYVEANALEEQAIALDPKDFVALAALGSNYLRLGDDKHGVEALQRAWSGDAYNVRTYNLLNLFEQVIPKSYEIIDGKPFRFRVATAERPILERYLVPMIAREYAEMVKRYGFEPKGPLIMELFTNPEHYAVRTVGLPGLEALGVTFGQVITAMSPSGGRFNWGMTLWHEVSHVFSIQMSKSRVPRWFTEGLAEYETQRERPDWTRHTHAELYRALEDKQLVSIGELNGAFTRARDVAHMVIAYHESAEAVSFLVRRWGFPKVPEALKLFAAGKTTRDVIPVVTGLSIAQFDEAFRADLAARLTAYKGTFFIRPSDYSDVDALEERIKTHPDDDRARALYALAMMHSGQMERAQELVEAMRPRIESRAPIKEPGRVLCRRLRGSRAGDAAQGPQVGQGLPRGAAEERRRRLRCTPAGRPDRPRPTATSPGAEREFTTAKKMDPERTEPYVELGKLMMKMRSDDALKELEQAARLDVMDGTVPKLLLEKYAAKQRWDKVLEWAPFTQFVDPFDVDVHTRYARALIETKKWPEAQAELQAALTASPEDEQKKTIDGLLARVKARK